MNKKIKILIILVAVFSVLIGGGVIFATFFVFNSLSKDKIVTEGDLSISIPVIFTKQEPYEGLDWVYLNTVNDIGICGNSDTFNELKREYRLEIDNIDEYIDLWIESGNYNDIFMFGPYDTGTYKYLEYQTVTDGEYFSYYSAAYHHNNTYYMITFYCPTNKYNIYKPDFNTWAESVTFE